MKKLVVKTVVCLSCSGIPCFNFSWICCCCYSGCSIHLELPRCWDCCSCNCLPCFTCRIPKCRCCSCFRSPCCKKISCSRNCCVCPSFSWPDCCCCKCKCKCKCECTCPKCPKVRPCSCCSCPCCCTKTCCNPCQLCF